MENELRQHYVYALFDCRGVIRYIGAGKGARWYEHRSTIDTSNPRKQAFVTEAIAVLGEIPRIKIAEGLTQQEAFDLEILLIGLIGKYPNGPLTNITDGGQGLKGSKHSEETKSQMSSSATGRVFTEEHKKNIGIASANREPGVYAKIGESNKGKIPWNKGLKGAYVPTVEARLKISRTHAGKPKSEEHKRKIGLGNKGKHNRAWSEEEKLAASLRSVGKKKPAKTKLKMKVAAKLVWAKPERVEAHKKFHTGRKRPPKAIANMKKAQKLIQAKKALKFLIENLDIGPFM